MVWGCLLWEGVGFSCKLDEKMDGDLYVAILEYKLQNSFEHYGKPLMTSSSSKTMTQENLQKMPRNGFEALYGLESHHTLILLKICGTT